MLVIRRVHWIEFYIEIIYVYEKNLYDVKACCKNQRSRHLNFVSKNLEKKTNTCHQKLGNEVGYTLKVSIQKGCLFYLNSWGNYLIYSCELWHSIYF